MEPSKEPQARAMPPGDVDDYLRDLKLAFIAQHYGELATQAAGKQWSHVEYLARLLEGEAHLRRDRATHNRIRQARFPVIKTLDQFRWDWPTQINRLQVQHHFGLGFLKERTDLIYLGGVGLGKTHLATALGYTACLQGYAVLFASVIEVINTLAAAKNAGRLKNRNSKNTPNRRCSSLTNLATSPLTSRGPISSSKSSACAMNRLGHDHLQPSV